MEIIINSGHRLKLSLVHTMLTLSSEPPLGGVFQCVPASDVHFILLQPTDSLTETKIGCFISALLMTALLLLNNLQQ